MSQTEPDLSGRTILITGGTSGIGKATTLGLARLGATLVLVGRDPSRGRQAVKHVVQLTGNGEIEFIVADLSLMSGVRGLARQILDSHHNLHVLINNAGVMMGRRQVTTEGLETTLAINHLAPFLLTELLLERLKQSQPSRIITVASAVHWSGTIDFANLQGESRYRPFAAYCNSKLANILFTRELSRRLGDTQVTANCLHPGMVRTRLVRQGSGPVMRLLWLLAAPLSIGATRGARTSIYLASAPEVGNVSGEYFVRCRPARSSSTSRDQELARRLWKASEGLVATS